MNKSLIVLKRNGILLIKIEIKDVFHNFYKMKILHFIFYYKYPFLSFLNYKTKLGKKNCLVKFYFLTVLL